MSDDGESKDKKGAVIEPPRGWDVAASASAALFGLAVVLTGMGSIETMMAALAMLPATLLAWAAERRGEDGPNGWDIAAALALTAWACGAAAAGIGSEVSAVLGFAFAGIALMGWSDEMPGLDDDGSGRFR
jgi:hypothetical protein